MKYEILNVFYQIAEKTQNLKLFDQKIRVIWQFMLLPEKCISNGTNYYVWRLWKYREEQKIFSSVVKFWIHVALVTHSLTNARRTFLGTVPLMTRDVEIWDSSCTAAIMYSFVARAWNNCGIAAYNACEAPSHLLFPNMELSRNTLLLVSLFVLNILYLCAQGTGVGASF